MTEYPGYEIAIFESVGAFYCCGTNCIACTPDKGGHYAEEQKRHEKHQKSETVREIEE